jgi:hypothetical protein
MLFTVIYCFLQSQAKAQAKNHANGQANGHSNGSANGQANGNANGHSNGKANDTTNGKAPTSKLSQLMAKEKHGAQARATANLARHSKFNGVFMSKQVFHFLL